MSRLRVTLLVNQLAEFVKNINMQGVVFQSLQYFKCFLYIYPVKKC